MMTKLFAMMLALSLPFSYDTTGTPMIISIDIEFCDINKAFEKSICTIQEAEYKSNNRLSVDQKGNLQNIIIDKRSITAEKADAIFENGLVYIENQSIINIPYLQKSILIRPGEYTVTELRRGYQIQMK